MAGFVAEGEHLVPSWLRDALRARLEGEIGLPVLSATACRVMAACQDEHSELRELAELVTHDQSLATHVLRVANSVGFAPKAPIQSLRQAIARLGLSTVSDIAIAVAIKQRVFTVPGHEARIRQLWLHSTACACFAKDIAQLLGGDQDSAFLGGLLHDVGMPIVMQAVCDLARERGTAPVSAAVMEEAMREFHCDFGTRVIQRWHLGPQVLSAIQHHHDPLGAQHFRDEVLTITLADELAYWAPDDAQDEEDFLLGRSLSRALEVSEDQFHSLLHSRNRILALARAFQ